MSSTERKNITQPASWWVAFEAAATEEGLTLSEWIGECCRCYVDEPLEDRPPAHRPRKESGE